ncbi:TSUP family transporter [Sphingomonas sp. MAH-20]|uniref:Probable membrane transporter protein n=1 Tax=Sphingomonas horti TaxID=2682842 RepID=A0A6I4J123_9SPHN|nr:sulfite exporter TauE/SafE family protein [Sphingomonas sp. CGMCC 1.13658]MVO78302.1 TSUP family transporter [Sphingomonas horti]
MALAAIGAGAINALAGGGSILTFPALIAAGVPPVAANVTNTVALFPGYIGGILGQARDLKGQSRRVWLLAPVALVGGLLGGFLILMSSAKLFQALVPWLLLGGCALLGIQDRIRGALQRRSGALGIGWAIAPVFLGAIYGGYFGAGLSVIFLAVLGLTIDDSLTRLNGLKQALSLSANLAAVLVFGGSGLVVWSAAAAMAGGSLIGGALGGRLASVVSPFVLRLTVMTIGVGVAVLFFFRY